MVFGKGGTEQHTSSTREPSSSLCSSVPITRIACQRQGKQCSIVLRRTRDYGFNHPWGDQPRRHPKGAKGLERWPPGWSKAESRVWLQTMTSSAARAWLYPRSFLGEQSWKLYCLKATLFHLRYKSPQRCINVAGLRAEQFPLVWGHGCNDTILMKADWTMTGQWHYCFILSQTENNGSPCLPRSQRSESLNNPNCSRFCLLNIVHLAI